MKLPKRPFIPMADVLLRTVAHDILVAHACDAALAKALASVGARDLAREAGRRARSRLESYRLTVERAEYRP